MHSVEDFQNIDAEFGNAFPIDMDFNMDMADIDISNVGTVGDSIQTGLNFYGH